MNNFIYLLGLYTPYGQALTFLGLITGIVQIISFWKIFKKAGQPGWVSLIPIYNVYVLYKICWDTKIYWINLLCSLGASLLASGIISTSSLAFALGSALLLVSSIIEILLYYHLSAAFGHGWLFALGMYFFPIIFVAILAFSRRKYEGNYSR